VLNTNIKTLKKMNDADEYLLELANKLNKNFFIEYEKKFGKSNLVSAETAYFVRCLELFSAGVPISENTIAIMLYQYRKLSKEKESDWQKYPSVKPEKGVYEVHTKSGSQFYARWNAKWECEITGITHFRKILPPTN
jgi:hypothetical protein